MVLQKSETETIKQIQQEAKKQAKEMTTRRGISFLNAKLKSVSEVDV